MGIAGEFVLECATDGAPETREKGAWAGDCFKLVGNLAGLRIEFKQEALFAFFDVQAGGGVEKAEAGWAVNDLFNSAHVERPEAQGMDFDGYELTRGYAGLPIGDAGPAKVEHLPGFEGVASGGEGGLAGAEFGLAEVMDEAGWKAAWLGQSFCQRKNIRRKGGQIAGGGNPLLDCRCGMFAKGEHRLSMPLVTQ